MATFHSLRVAAVTPLCDDAVAIRFDVPDELAAEFRHLPGQNLTVRRLLDGREERRSYSICSPAGSPPAIGVRELPGGALSGWLVHQVRPGDALEVSPPTGRFAADVSRPGRHVLIGAGSGITPLLSIAASALAADMESSVALLYGNRTARSIMFVDELADLKDAHGSRFQVVHVLSREARDADLLSGRLDPPKLRQLLPLIGGPDDVDHWWLCGPHELVTAAVDLLRSLGVPDARIHRELFWVEAEPPPPARHIDLAQPGVEVSVQLDGRTSTVTVPAGTSILEAAQPVRPDLPFACRSGVCGTCRALVKSGTVTLRRNFALEPAELEAGYVLTCQAECAGEPVAISYDD